MKPWIDSARLCLIGPPRLELPGEPAQPLPWQRPVVLAALLACREGWIARDALALALRPDADGETARAYLRRLLHRLRSDFPALADAVQQDGQRLRWSGGCDVRDLLAAHAAQDWVQVHAAGAAPFVDGTPALGDEALDNWVEDQRLTLRQTWRTACSALIGLRPPATPVAPLMQALLDDDPLDEDGVALVLSQARDAVERRIALAGYERLARGLAQEMALKPLPATRILAERLREAAVDPPAPGPRPPSSGPAPREPLVGRDAECARLTALLAAPDTRWVTLRGLGGVGKTALAREVCARLAPEFTGAVVWVDVPRGEADLLDRVLQALETVGSGAAGLSGPQRLAAALQALAPRRLLVVLDGLDERAEEVGALLPLIEGAPGLRWLATSREPVPVRLAHDVELGGLPHDEASAAAQALFAQHAERHGSRLAAADAPAVAALARAVDGLPLALELAAAWTPLMPVADIAAEVRRDLSFLRDPHDAADRPLAQRSLRAVFDATWDRLPAVERSGLSALSVMRGAFDRDAALAVSRATPHDLLRWVGRSLLQRAQRDGADARPRFRLHALVREFAQSSADASDLAAARARHAAHFLRLAGEGAPIAFGDWDHPRLQLLAPWHDELAGAWMEAVARRRDALLRGALGAVQASYTQLNRDAALLRLLQAAEPLFDGADGERLRAAQATALVRLERFDEAEPIALALLSAGAHPEAAHAAATCVARIVSLRGDLQAAGRWLERAQAEAQAWGDPFARLRAHQNLGALAFNRGDLAQARSHFEAMLELAESVRSRNQKGRALRALGQVDCKRGQAGDALPMLLRAVELLEPVDGYETALAQQAVAWARLALNDAAAAERAAAGALERFDALGRKADAARCRLVLADAQQRRGDGMAAMQARATALRSALASGLDAVVLACIAALAPTVGASAQRLARWRSVVGAHPPLDPADRDALAQAQGPAPTSDAEVDVVPAVSRPDTLTAVAEDVLAHVARHEAAGAPSGGIGRR